MPATMERKGRTGDVPARMKEIGGRVRVALRSALETLGPELVASIRAELRAVRPGLHPFTVARNGGRAQPLLGTRIDEAITWRVESTERGAFVWAGVPASAGAEVLMLTRIHEQGATIDVTPSMRGYLHAQGLHLRPDTLAIVIPPRPFIQQGLANARGGARSTVRQAVTGALRGR